MTPRQSNHVTRFVGRLGPSLYRKLNQRNIQNVDVIYDYMMRQLAHESDYGRSDVAVNQHNYGGYGWDGKTYTTFNSDDEFLDSYLDIMQGRHKDALGAQNITQYAKSLKDTNYFEAPLEEYVGSLNGMKSLGRVLASHRADNPDLYTVNQVPQESELVQQLRASQQNHPIKPAYRNGKLPKFEDGKKNSSLNVVKNILHPVDMIRKRLYENVFPYTYDDIQERLNYALLRNQQSDSDKGAEMSYMMQFGMPQLIDDLWGTYLQIPDNQRHYNRVLGISKYAPSNAVDKNTKYYTVPFERQDKDAIIRNALMYGNDKNAPKLLNPDLGNYTTGRGRDDNGDYVSYYDIWDLNPFRGITNVANKYANKVGLNKVGDLSMGIGNPLEIYDRIYLDDYYGIKGNDRGGTYLPEVIVTNKKSKPEEEFDESIPSRYKNGKTPRLKYRQ